MPTDAQALIPPQQEPPPQQPPQERLARIHVVPCASPKGARAPLKSATVRLRNDKTKNDNKNISEISNFEILGIRNELTVNGRNKQRGNNQECL